MCELPGSHSPHLGIVVVDGLQPDVVARCTRDAPLLDDLAALGRDLRLVIEQDMYPAPAGSAKAIATRTREYFAGLGLLPAKS